MTNLTSRKKPAWLDHPARATPEQAFRRLELATIEDAARTIKLAVKKHEEWTNTVRNLRYTVEWLLGLNHEPNGIAFAQVCKHLHREPTAAADALLAKIPPPLTRLVMRAPGTDPAIWENTP